MRERSHDFRIVAHDRWFGSDGRLTGQDWLQWSDHHDRVWRYPEPCPGPIWRFERYRTAGEPQPAPLLEMLWAEEMRAMCRSFAVAAGPRAPRPAMRRALADSLTGRQIRTGVCAALRGRAFAEADPAMREAA